MSNELGGSTNGGPSARRLKFWIKSRKICKTQLFNNGLMDQRSIRTCGNEVNLIQENQFSRIDQSNLLDIEGIVRTIFI